MGMKEVQQETEALFIKAHEHDTIIFVDPEQEYSYTDNCIMKDTNNPDTTNNSDK